MGYIKKRLSKRGLPLIVWVILWTSAMVFACTSCIMLFALYEVLWNQQNNREIYEFAFKGLFQVLIIEIIVVSVGALSTYLTNALIVSPRIELKTQRAQEYGLNAKDLYQRAQSERLGNRRLEYRTALMYCLDAYRRAKAIEPGNPEWRTSIGTVLNELGQFEDAKLELEEAIQLLNPKLETIQDEAKPFDWGWTYAELAAALTMLDGGAVGEAEKYLAHAPKHGAFYQKLLKKYKDNQEMFKQHIASKPTEGH